MNVRVYLRIAQDPKTGAFKVAATVRPSTTPLRLLSSEPLPTLSYVLTLDVPGDAFAPIDLGALTVTRGMPVPIEEVVEQ